MADNFFGIDTDFTEANEVNDILFSDADPATLELAKKKEEEDKKKKEDEAKKKAETDAAAQKAAEEAKKKAATGKKDDDTTPLDATDEIFGKKPDEDGPKDDAVDDENKDEDPKEDEEVDDNQFVTLSKELYKIGVFTPDVDEEGEEILHTAKTPEEFKKLFEYQKEGGMYAMLDAHLSKFGADRLQLFDAIFNKGVDPKEYIPVYNQIANFEALTTDTEANQEKIVREFLKRSGLPEDKIPTRIQRLKDIAELQAEAEEALPIIIAQDKKALKDQEDSKAAANQAKEAKDKQYKSSIAKILTEKIAEKEFDGIPVNQQSAQKAFDFLYNKKWVGKDGEKFTDFDKFILELNNPENHALKVKVGLLAQQNFDLSKVQKKAISKESSELFKEFTTKKTKQATTAAKAAPWNL